MSRLHHNLEISNNRLEFMPTTESIIWKHIVRGSVLVVAWTVLFFLLQYGFAERASQFLDKGQNVVAKVVDKQCQNHGSIGYELFLKGERYRKTSTNCFNSCEEASLGDPVDVRYIRDDPNVSECGSVEDIFSRAKDLSFISLILPWMIVCFMLVLGIWVHCLKTLEDLQKSE